jgi:predicted RNase H-related nuclease YkuK (DUF458 family)
MEIGENASLLTFLSVGDREAYGPLLLGTDSASDKSRTKFFGAIAILKHLLRGSEVFFWIHIITCSALALSTVLRTTSLSYGNMPFSGTHRTKTP